MVVLSPFNSNERPVIPSLSTTSLAIVWLLQRDYHDGTVQVKPFSGAPSSPRLFYHRSKFGKQRGGIMRSRRGFRVVLDAKNGPGLVPHAFHGLVVQVDPIHNHVSGQGSRVHRETMVLRGDFHPAGRQILHRLVCAAVAKFQFEGPSAKGLPQNLVPQTDAKNRNARLNKVPHGPDRVAEGGGTARAVEKENPA